MYNSLSCYRRRCCLFFPQVSVWTQRSNLDWILAHRGWVWDGQTRIDLHGHRWAAQALVLWLCGLLKLNERKMLVLIDVELHLTWLWLDYTCLKWVCMKGLIHWQWNSKYSSIYNWLIVYTVFSWILSWAPSCWGQSTLVLGRKHTVYSSSLHSNVFFCPNYIKQKCSCLEVFLFFVRML